jgi:hypothetical protein
LFAIAPGRYGHQWVGKHGGTGDQKAAAHIVVKPGKTVTAPAVLLDPAGTVTGVVTGSDGKPVANGYAAFSAWGDAGPGWDTGTNQNGRYTLGKLGPYAWPLLFGGGIDPRQWSGNVANRFQHSGPRQQDAEPDAGLSGPKPGAGDAAPVSRRPDFDPGGYRSVMRE